MPQSDDILALLSQHGIPFKIRGHRALCRCPFCGGGRKKSSLSIDLETTRFICNRQNECGMTGNYRTLRAFLEGNDKPIERKVWFPERLEYRKPDPLKIKEAMMKTEKPECRCHLDWLASRKISINVSEDYGLHCHHSKTSDKAIAFPIYDEEGTLVNCKYRSLTEKKFWSEGGARYPFGLQLVAPDTNTILIVEGEMDCLAAYEYGLRNVISLPNGVQDQGWIEPLWHWLEKFSEIYLCTDMDPAGRDALKVLVERLGSWRCKGVSLPHKDMNDCLMAGVPFDKIIEALSKAQEFKPDLLVFASAFEDEVVDAFRNRNQLFGTPTGFRALDDILKGFRQGEVTIWSGENGSGKSTVLGQVALNLGAMGERVCMASLELSPKRYLRWLVCQYLDEADPPDEEIRQAVREIGQHLALVNKVGSLPAKQLLDIWEYAARRYGVTHFMADSLLKLGVRGDDYDGQREILNSLADFADKWGHVHLVTHNRKGQGFGKGPEKSDVKGSGDMVDLTDNLLMIERDEDVTRVLVKKHREHGTLGKVELRINPLTKRVTCEEGIIGNRGAIEQGPATIDADSLFTSKGRTRRPHA